jgi:hypothetical protein
MIDLAVITAVLAHDRVVDQFAGPAVTAVDEFRAPRPTIGSRSRPA